MMQQTFYDFPAAFEILKDKRPLLVCDNAFDFLKIKIPCDYSRFSDFTPNPLYEDAKKGIKVLRKNKCDFIVAIGGGSSIDTAKSIKYYNHVNTRQNKEQKIIIKQAFTHNIDHIEFRLESITVSPDNVQFFLFHLQFISAIQNRT